MSLQPQPGPRWKNKKQKQKMKKPWEESELLGPPSRVDRRAIGAEWAVLKSQKQKKQRTKMLKYYR